VNIYESKHYKLLLLIPIAILLISIYFSTQVEYGIDLKGGSVISAPLSEEIDTAAFEAKLLENFKLEDLSIRQVSGAMNGIQIEFLGESSILDATEMLENKQYAEVIEISKQFTGELEVSSLPESDQADVYFTTARENFKNDLILFLSTDLGVESSEFSIQEVGPSLGDFFLSQSITAIFLAFLFITLLIFYYFRNPVVSFAAAQSAFFDVLVGYAVLGFFKIPLSLATIAPLLMIIGYSIDTDIMLNDRMLKRKTGTMFGRLRGAMKTGLTMTLTALFTMGSLLVVSYYANIMVLFYISLMLFVGLLADLISTWCTNAVLIVWFLQNKEKGKK